MKYCFLSALILCCAFSIKAQTFFMNQPIAFNPSMAGSANVSRVNLTGQLSDPTNFGMSFDTYVGALRGGLGFTANRGDYGENTNTGSIIYSPKFTAKKIFTIAPSFGMGIKNSNYSTTATYKGGVLVNTKKAFFGISGQLDPSEKPYRTLKLHMAYKHDFTKDFSSSAMLQSGITSSNWDLKKCFNIFSCETFDPEHGFVGNYITQYRIYNHQLGMRLNYRKWKVGGGVSHATMKSLKRYEEDWNSDSYFTTFYSAGYETELVGVYLVGSRRSQYITLPDMLLAIYRYPYTQRFGSLALSFIYKFKKQKN